MTPLIASPTLGGKNRSALFLQKSEIFAIVVLSMELAMPKDPELLLDFYRM
jgi:hypothetical protein